MVTSTPASAAAAITARALELSRVNGFSHRTWIRRRSKCRETSAWLTGGVHTMAASSGSVSANASKDA